MPNNQKEKEYVTLVLKKQQTDISKYEPLSKMNRESKEYKHYEQMVKESLNIKA